MFGGVWYSLASIARAVWNDDIVAVASRGVDVRAVDSIALATHASGKLPAHAIHSITYYAGSIVNQIDSATTADIAITSVDTAKAFILPAAMSDVSAPAVSFVNSLSNVTTGPKRIALQSATVVRLHGLVYSSSTNNIDYAFWVVEWK